MIILACFFAATTFGSLAYAWVLERRWVAAQVRAIDAEVACLHLQRENEWLRYGREYAAAHSAAVNTAIRVMARGSKGVN